MTILLGNAHQKPSTRLCSECGPKHLPDFPLRKIGAVSEGYEAGFLALRVS